MTVEVLSVNMLFFYLWLFVVGWKQLHPLALAVRQLVPLNSLFQLFPPAAV